MESIADTYERYVNEIQFLKKQVSGEKLAHENTLKQLQSAYEIMDEMKDLLRNQQSANFKLKSEVADRTNRMAAMSSQYEDQIREIKDMINLKDEELRRMSSVLMVSDYDVIRLKVINELEMTQREEVDRLNQEISKRTTECTEIRSNYALLVNKQNYLTAQLKKQEEEFSSKLEEASEKYMRETKTIYQNLQRERNEHQKLVKKMDSLESKHRKQVDIYKEEINKLKRELDNQNKNVLSNNPNKAHKIKMEKLEEQLGKVKEELDSEKEQNKKNEDEISKLKKEIKNYKKNQHDYISDKEKRSEQIEYLRKDMQLKESQYARQLEKLRKQSQNRSENDNYSSKQEKDKLNKLQLQNKRLTFKVDSLQEQIKMLKEKNKDGGLALIKKQLNEKEVEIEQLLVEISNYKKRQNEAKRNKPAEKKDDFSAFKRKLQEANEKIVDLLKQKIELKQQIATLKSNP